MSVEGPATLDSAIGPSFEPEASLVSGFCFVLFIFKLHPFKEVLPLRNPFLR